MSETGEGAKPEGAGITLVNKVGEYLQSTVDHGTEQRHIDQSTSPLRGLLQRFHDARLTNAGIIDRVKSIRKK